MIREALKEELLAEFNAIPPLEELQKMYSFSERHVKQMEAIFADLRKREQKEQYWHTVRKVAIIIIAVLAAVFASVKFVPEVYAYVKEWLMEFADDESIEFRGSGSGRSVEDGEILRFELGYVPEGYELEREESSKIGTHRVFYKDSDGIALKLEYRGKLNENLVALNTEGVLVAEVDIFGIRYYVFECEMGKYIVAWEQENYMLSIEGVLTSATMLDIATSVLVDNIK